MKHKAVIEKQKSVADKAGESISSKIIGTMQTKQVLASVLNKQSREKTGKNFSAMLVSQFVKLLDKPTNETLRIGAEFAKDKLSNVSA